MRAQVEVPINQRMIQQYRTTIQTENQNFVRELLTVYSRLRAKSEVTPLDLLQFKTAIIAFNQSRLAMHLLEYERYPNNSRIRHLLINEFNFMSSYSRYKSRIDIQTNNFVENYAAQCPLPRTLLQKIWTNTRLIWLVASIVLLCIPPTAAIGFTSLIWAMLVITCGPTCPTTINGGSYEDWIRNTITNSICREVGPYLPQEELDSAFVQLEQLADNEFSGQQEHRGQTSNQSSSSTRVAQSTIPYAHAVPVDDNSEEGIDEQTALLRKNAGLLTKVSMLSQTPYGATATATVNSSSSSSSSSTHEIIPLIARNDNQESNDEDNDDDASDTSSLLL